MKRNDNQRSVAAGAMLAIALWMAAIPVGALSGGDPLEHILAGCGVGLKFVGFGEPLPIDQPQGWDQGIMVRPDYGGTVGLFLLNYNPPSGYSAVHYIMNGWTDRPVVYCENVVCPWFDDIQKRIEGSWDGTPEDLESIVASVDDAACTIEAPVPPSPQNGPPG